MTKFQLDKRKCIIPYNTEGKYDKLHTYGPCVIKEGNYYKMWYSGVDKNNRERILYAISKDGINWKDHRLVLDLGKKNTISPYHQWNQDFLHVYAPFVMKFKTHYKMWYLGKYDEHIYKLFYAVSKDGISWIKLGLSLDLQFNAINVKGYNGKYDTHHCSYPFVWIDKEGIYNIFYTGKDRYNQRILKAYSFDGFHWFRQGLVLDISNKGADSKDVCYPHLLLDKNNNPKEMFYTGFDGTHKVTMLATTENKGKSWKKQGVILSNSENGPDSVHAYTPCVIKEGNLYKIWYSSYDGKHYQICYVEGKKC